MSWGLFLLYLPVALGVSPPGNQTKANIQLASFSWESVEKPYTLCLWLLIAAVAKIIFHLMKPLSTMLPDSSLLVIVGLILGIIINYFAINIDISLDSHAFFLYLLPPIIFDAGYFMPNRALFENWDSVLLFSVCGTIWNCIAIGSSLLLLSWFNIFTMSFSIAELFVFASLISAVDPVAVIAVFEELNVNKFLFVNVFGEALFNDAITVVIYHIVKSFTLNEEGSFTSTDYMVGFMSFFVVALGGAAIGLIFAFLTAWITKYTTPVQIFTPVFIFVLPYMAYLTAEMTTLSSIIAIAVCGMAMKQYVKENISPALADSIKCFTKVLAQSSEAVVFMFLGLSTINSNHYWDTWFVVATVSFCLIWRTVGVLTQCWLLNKLRKKKFTKIDQFVLSYGGFRGVIGFGMAFFIPASIAAKQMFITTTTVVIFFNVFLQGITIRPLMEYLIIETKDHRSPTMPEIVYNKYLDYIMSGVEEIAGQKSTYTLLEKFDRFNAKVLRPILLRNEPTKEFDMSTIIRGYAKITLEDALNVTREHKLPQNKTITHLKMIDTQEAYRGSEKTSISEEKYLQNSLNNRQDMEHSYVLVSDFLKKKLGVKNNINKSHILDDYIKQLINRPNLSLNHGNIGEEFLEVPLSMGEFKRDRRWSTGDIGVKKAIKLYYIKTHEG